MSDQPSAETDLLHYGPCVHCGHLSDEHGERGACLRAGYYGNTYGCCEVNHQPLTRPGRDGA